MPGVPLPVLAAGGPVLDLNFLAMGAAGALDPRVSFSRSSSAWYFNSSGLLVSASSNVPRFDYGLGGTSLLGLLWELQSANLALYSRDLTNAVWTKTNCTAAKDQTGIDGQSNSASSLTATANGGTCLQAITQASASDTFSVYLKRITGTGTVKITLDGGSTYTDVTSSLSSSAWARVSANETVTNSNFGIQLGTNGDKIAVDVAQIEVGLLTSPIITTSATVVRAGDAASATVPYCPSGTLIARAMPSQKRVASGGPYTADIGLSDNHGSSSQGISLNWTGNTNGNGDAPGAAVNNGSGSATYSTSWASFSPGFHTLGIAWISGEFWAEQDGAIFPSMPATSALTPTSQITTLQIGSVLGRNWQPGGIPLWVSRIRLWNRALSSAQLLQLGT